MRIFIFGADIFLISDENDFLKIKNSLYFHNSSQKFIQTKRFEI